MPTTVVPVRLSARAGGTGIEVCSQVGSREQMEQLVSMGMVEGFSQAAGQMDALLAG